MEPSEELAPAWGFQSWQLYAASAFFLASWVLIALKVKCLPIGKTAGAMMGACLMVAFGIITGAEANRSIEMNTLLLLIGLMLILGFLESKGFVESLCAFMIKGSSLTPAGLLVRVCVISTILGALIMNDGSALLMSAVVVALCDQYELPLHPFLVAVATSANIGSAATILGNPKNMLIHSKNNLSFVAFSSKMAPPAVVAAVVNTCFLWLVFRRSLNEHYDNFRSIIRTESDSTTTSPKRRQKGRMKLMSQTLTREESIMQMVKSPSSPRHSRKSMFGGASYDALFRSTAPSVIHSSLSQMMPYFSTTNSHITRPGFDHDDDHSGLVCPLHPDRSMIARQLLNLFVDPHGKVYGKQIGNDECCCPADTDEDTGRGMSSGDSSGGNDSDEDLLDYEEEEEEFGEEGGGVGDYGAVKQRPVRFRAGKGSEENSGLLQASDESLPATEKTRTNVCASLVGWWSEAADAFITDQAYRVNVLTVASILLMYVGFLCNFSLGWTCLGVSVLIIIIDGKEPTYLFAEINWSLIMFLISMFVLIEGVNATAVPGQLWKAVEPFLVDTASPHTWTVMTLLVSLLAFGSLVVVICVVFTSIPCVLLVAPHLPSLTGPLGEEGISWLLLAWCVTLCGNLTVFSSVAGVIANEAAGHDNPINLWMWTKNVFPMTLVTMAIGMGMLMYTA